MATFTDAESLVKHLAALDDDGAALTDLRFQCNDGDVPAHLAIVAAWSGKVRELALSTAARPLLLDVRPNSCAHVRLTRTFLYTGELAITAATATALTSISNRVGIPALKHSVESAAVGRYLDASSACGYLLVGRRDGSLSVEGASRAYIRANTAACIHSPSFFELDPDSLQSILEEEELSVREEDLFRQVLAWADVRAGKLAGADAPVDSAKADPHLVRKAAREALIRRMLPSIRFPTMGAHVFARTVVPTGVLPNEDANAVLMHFMAPDIAAPMLRFKPTPRTGTGSVYCWSAAAAGQAGVTTLSKDRRVVEFKCTPPGRPVMLVSDQAFAAGVSTVYVTTWGCASLTLGVMVSDSDVDDGDCAMMAGGAAAPDSDRFEGVTLYDAPRGDTPSTTAAVLTSNVHKARLEGARGVGGASSPSPPLTLTEGCTLILSIDWDVHEVVVSVWAQGSPGGVRVATLRSLPAKPLRVCAGAQPRASGGDVDGVAVIASKPPAYLFVAAGAAAPRDGPATHESQPA